jgi:hypothetical protein
MLCQVNIMDRLNFVLPDFARISWVSDRAREVWEARIIQITNAWMEVEWRAVGAGIRPCGLTMASPEKFLERAAEWLQHGVTALPLEIERSSNGASSEGGEIGSAGPFSFRFVMGTPQSVLLFKDALDRGDDREVGRLLGHPACCDDFLRSLWVDYAQMDTTWPMAEESVSSPNGSHCIEVTGPQEANILWRWMGVRAIPHLPCRFNCPRSIDLGKSLLAFGRAEGYEREMDWMSEILSWPVEWSALHGIAEIKTPILKVCTRTDATPSKYVVRFMGNSYPPEGAQGLNFPYRPGGAEHKVAL